MKLKYSPDGRAPTDDDIKRAANFNPVIRACIALADDDQLTYRQSLIMMVLALADQNEKLHSMLVEAQATQRTIYIHPA